MGIEIPEIVDLAAAPTALIRIEVPREEMVLAFPPAVTELFAVLGRQGAAQQSAVFAHHVAMSPDKFDFELGVKVAAPVLPIARVETGKFPGGRMARVVYAGGYDGLHAAWAEFDAWIAAQGVIPAVDLWEFYDVGPHVTEDETAWRTALLKPLL